MSKIKINQNSNLFWYFKEGVELDLSSDWAKRVYIKEVLTNGKQKDIKKIFTYFNEQEIKDVFDDIKMFLPKRVKSLWEDYFERTLGNNSSSK